MTSYAVMSSNGDTNVVLRGVTHGAVDFLIKPVRIEEIRNVWQHIVRRRSQVGLLQQVTYHSLSHSTLIVSDYTVWRHLAQQSICNRHYNSFTSLQFDFLRSAKNRSIDVE